VVPDSDRVAGGVVSSVLYLNVSVVYPDKVSGVQVEVLDAEHQVTVIHEVFRLLHINVVLTHCRWVIMIVVEVTEHGNRLVVEIVTTKLRLSIVNVVLKYLAGTSER